jgi:hypothetical protein
MSAEKKPLRLEIEAARNGYTLRESGPLPETCYVDGRDLLDAVRQKLAGVEPVKKSLRN